MSSRPLSSQRGAVGKVLLIVGVVVVLLLIFGYSTVQGTYNTFVTQDELVEQRWASLESAYKRRFDLIPQLVGVVQGAADFEQDTFTAVTEARAKVSQVQLGGEAPTDPAQLERFVAAQDGLGSALSRLLVSVEAYPQLRATEAFRDLQSQVEGSENRIAVAREDYMQSVRDYNTSLRRFPASIIAGFTGFDVRPQLQQAEGVDETPVIDFGNG